MELTQNILLDRFIEYLKEEGFITAYRVTPEECVCTNQDLHPTVLLEEENLTYQITKCNDAVKARLRVRLHMFGNESFDAFRTTAKSVTALNAMAARALWRFRHDWEIVELEEVFAKTPDDGNCGVKLHSQLAFSFEFQEDFSREAPAPKCLERIIFDLGGRNITFCDEDVLASTSHCVDETQTTLFTSSGDLIVDNNGLSVII